MTASTPSGRGSSWLYTLCDVRPRRQALCRLDVRGLFFITGDTGEPNMSKANCELFIGEAVLASFSGAVSSGRNENEHFLFC